MFIAVGLCWRRMGGTNDVHSVVESSERFQGVCQPPIEFVWEGMAAIVSAGRGRWLWKDQDVQQ